jgi:hypothetical protein
MGKTLIATCAAALLAVFASAAYAQTDTPGEGRAAPSKPATKAEKQAAKEKRRSTSKDVVKKDEGRTDRSTSSGKAKSASAEEKAAARSKRQAAGKETAKTGSAGGEAATMGK